MNRRSLLHAGVALFANLPRAGFGASTAWVTTNRFPRTVVDARGCTVHLKHAPERIVAVFPSNIEIAFALGLEERIIAVGGRVRWPSAALKKPSVGGSLGYSAEAVAAYRPDLIVLTPSDQTALGLIAPFERLGVPVLVLQHPDLPAILRNIRLLGQATGCEAQAESQSATMIAQLDALQRRLRGVRRRTVYLETGATERGTFQTVGRGHYANDALFWAGGENVFADLKGSRQVSGEAIFLRNPEVVISLQQRPGSPSHIAQRPGWSALSAVRQNRVSALERGHKLIPGPRQVEAIWAYAKSIHPERFDA